jgi:hypothetical protein
VRCREHDCAFLILADRKLGSAMTLVVLSCLISASLPVFGCGRRGWLGSAYRKRPCTGRSMTERIGRMTPPFRGARRRIPGVTSSAGGSPAPRIPVRWCPGTPPRARSAASAVH